MRELHQNLGASFLELNGEEIVAGYGKLALEYRALTQTAALLDLSPRGRLCLLGNDRSKFLHGQVTNDIKALQSGAGCYALLVTNKGKVQADMNVFNLGDELLLDLEPGQSGFVTERLEKFLVADDVEICDVQPQFGLLSLQGPKAGEALSTLGIETHPPGTALAITRTEDPTLGTLFIANHARVGTAGFDLFVEDASLPAIADKLARAVQEVGGCPAGWEALEIARIEAGIPRCGQDMSEKNLAPETGVENRAISYKKGCYIGQEVLNRLHTFAEVKRRLVRLEMDETVPTGTALTHDGKDIGLITSSATLPGEKRNVGLAYIRKPHDEAGTQLSTSTGQTVTVR
jgi:folate-binding protein YgfZ